MINLLCVVSRLDTVRSKIPRCYVPRYPGYWRRVVRCLLEAHPGSTDIIRRVMPFNRHPAYDQIATELRRAILAGDYEPSEQDPTRHQLPGAAELGVQYGVSAKTA